MDNYNENLNNVVSGVEQAKKGKGGLIAGITAGVVLVGAGGGAVAYATSDYVKNQVKLATSSPENYYTWVTEKNTDDFAKAVSEQYRQSIEDMKSGQKCSASLKYDINDTAKNELLEYMTDDEQEIIDVIKNFSSIAVGVNADTKDNLTSGNAFVEWNGEKLASFDMACDLSAMDMLFRVPELTEQWLDIDVNDIYGYDYYNDDSNKDLNASEKIRKDPESVITPEELETEITKYMNIWNECIADVELEKKADIAISDINVNYTVATVTIDETKAKEISEKFINTVKEDEILKSIVVDRLEVADADKYISDLDDALAEINENYDENSTDTVTLNTYIDPTGCIRGISFETSENDSAKFIIGKDGDELRGEFFVSEDGEEDFKGILTAKDNGGKYTGAFDMTVDDETVSVEFTDLETVDEKKGYMNGVLTFVLPQEVIDAEADVIFSISLNSDNSSQQIAIPLDIADKNYGTLTLSISSEIGAEPSMPDKSGAFVINDDTDAELSDYVERDKMEEFIKNILLKVGFNEEMATEGANDLGEELYYDYSADFDYDNLDTDFSYGWDDDDFDSDDDDDYSTSGSFDDDPEYDPYADMVIAKDGQAYLCVVDNSLQVMYGGYESVLAYDATLADITGNGTYTVKVTADTDGYRKAMDDVKPNGVMLLGVEAMGLENADNAVIDIKSVKIDSKEFEIVGTADSEFESESGTLYALICNGMTLEEGGEHSIIDVSSVGEWTDIEVTFEVKGME
ncbi:MAG: hypothetical protein K2K91_07635 [Ruminococcus sp.]|nr:hypothetical protein [Ruminococcus sp.]